LIEFQDSGQLQLFMPSTSTLAPAYHSIVASEMLDFTFVGKPYSRGLEISKSSQHRLRGLFLIDEEN
jgi:hypothetical protein